MRRETASSPPPGDETSAMFEALFLQNKAIMWLVNPGDGRIVEANHAAAEFYGYPREQLARMTVMQINIMPAAEMKRELEAAQTEQRSFFRFRHRLADGRIRDVEVSSGPVWLAGRKLLLSVMRDVTRRNRAERALRAQNHCRTALLQARTESEALENICRSLVEEAGYHFAWVGYPLQDPAKTIAVQTVCGDGESLVRNAPLSWSPDHPMGVMPCSQAIRSGRPKWSLISLAEEPVADWQQHLAQLGVTSVLALPLLCGETPWGVLTLASSDPEAFDDEEVELLQGMADSLTLGVDMLRHRETQQQLEQRLRRERDDLQRARAELETALARLQQTQAHLVAQEKLAAIGQLSAGVAHEINNPAGFIGSNLTSLAKYVARLKEYITAQDRWLDGAADEALQAEIKSLRQRLKVDFLLDDIADLVRESQDGAERIRTIAQNLKTFARAEDDTQQAVDLNACLESTLTIVWNELKYKAQVERQFGELPTIQGNAQQLGQVFLNLLVNAGQAIDAQGTIRVRSWAEDGRAHVCVSDTGCGIAPEHLDHIFEPFFTTKPAGQGTGLGMSIASEILHKHQGDIQVTSEVGRGTTFTVRLPLPKD